MRPTRLSKAKAAFIIVGISSSLLSASANIITNQLVAYYPFNGSALDESGNGNDGSVIGATLTADRFGNANSAYHFDGVNDYIDLGSMGGLKTVSMWIKQGPRSGFDFYLGHNDFRFYASTAESGRLTLGEAASHVVSPVHMDSQVNQWIHIVGISDGVDSKIYLNSTNVTVSTGNLKTVENAAVNLGRWTEATHYMNGDIDDVRIYDRVLTNQEIATLYAIPEPSTALLLSFSGVLLFKFRRKLFR